jgi:hypothetical protein
LVKLELFGSGDQVIFSPTFGRAVTAAGKEPVQYRQVDGPLDVELEPAAVEQRAQAFQNPAFLPEPAKDQVRSPPAHRHRLQFASGMSVQDGKGLTMAQAGAHQPFPLTAGL